MQNEKFYSVVGQLLMAALLLLAIGAVFLTSLVIWQTLFALAHVTIDDRLAVLVALAGVLLLIVLARKRVGLLLVFSLLIGGANRLLLAESYPVLNGIVGGLCLFFAALMILGQLSEKADWARRIFPSVLLGVAVAVFLVPVALLTKMLAALRIIPKQD